MSKTKKKKGITTAKKCKRIMFEANTRLEFLIKL